MSGNDERLTIEISKEMFMRSCPKCQNTTGYDFVHGWRDRHIAIRVTWSLYKDNWNVSQYDRRTTRNSFVKKKIRCSGCWEYLEDEDVRVRLIDMVSKKLRFWNER